MSEQVGFELNLEGNYAQTMGQAIAVSRQYVDVADGIKGKVGNLSSAMTGLTLKFGQFNKTNTVALDTAASYQKALSGIEAGAVVTGKSFEALSATTKRVARDMPIGIGGAVAVVESLQSVGIKSEKQIDSLAKSVVRLGAATGSSAPEMGKDFIQLGKAFGNTTSQFEALGDSLTTVTRQMGASAPSVVAFSKAMAPVAATVGIGQTSIMGLSAAMSSLGEDGYRAANTFNKVLLDMNRSIRDGGPELKAYSDILGMTSANLKDLFKSNPTEVLSRFSDAVAKSGPNVSRTMEALGFDSVRDTRSLTALARAGGPREAIQTAVNAYGNKSTEKTAAVAMEGVIDRADMLKESMSQVVDNLGAPMLNLAKFQLSIAKIVPDTMNAIVGSPVVQNISKAGGVVGVIGGMAGGAFNTLTTLAMVKMGYNWLKKSGVAEGVQLGRATAESGGTFKQAGVAGGQLAGRAGGIGARVGYGMESAMMATRMSSIPQALSTMGAMGKWGAAATADLSSRLGTGFYRNVFRGGMGQDAIRTEQGQHWMNTAGGLAKTISGRLGEGETPTSRAQMLAASKEYAKGLGQQGFWRSMGNLGKTGAMIGVDATKFGAGMVGGTLGGIGKGLNAIGMGPSVLGLIGASIAGQQMWSKKQEGQTNIETIQSGFKDVYGSFNAFAEAAGGAGREIQSFGQATAVATANLASQTTTMDKAFTLSKEEATQARQTSYTSDLKLVGDDKSTAAIVGQVQGTLGPYARPEEIKRALMDVASQTSQTAADEAGKVLKPLYDTITPTIDYKSMMGMLTSQASNNPLAILGSTNETQALIGKQMAQVVGQKGTEADTIYGGTMDVGGQKITAGSLTGLQEAQKLYEAALAEGVGRTGGNTVANVGAAAAANTAIAGALGVSSNDIAMPMGLGMDSSKSSGGDMGLVQGWTWNDIMDKGLTAGGFGGVQGAKDYAALQAAGKNPMTMGLAAFAEMPKPEKENRDAEVAMNKVTGAANGLTSALYEGAAAAREYGTVTSKLTRGQMEGMTATGRAVAEFGKAPDARTEKAAGVALATDARKNAGGNLSLASYNLQLEAARQQEGSYQQKAANAALAQLNPQIEIRNAARGQNARLLETARLGWQAEAQPPATSTGAAQVQQSTIDSGKVAQAQGIGQMRATLLAFQQMQRGNMQAARSAGITMGAIARDGALKVKWATEDHQKSMARAEEDYNIQKKRVNFDYNRSVFRATRDQNRQMRYMREDHERGEFRAERDFKIQMTRAEEDHNTQTKRAIADHNKDVSRAWRDHNIQLSRAQRDFDKSMARAEADHLTQETRATEDYQKSTMRAQRDFDIQMGQAAQDYNKNRTRAFEDYNKQVKRMVEDSAKQMYDPYKRIAAQMVMDGGQLVQNLKDQTNAIQGQVDNLAKARAMGLSEEAIKALNLADAANAQQLGRLVADMGGNKEIVTQLNTQVSAKNTAASSLVQDQGNVPFARLQEDFSVSIKRMDEDYATMTSRATEAFSRQMGDAQIDFSTAMKRMDEDYALSTARATEDFGISISDMKLDFRKALEDGEIDFKTAMDRMDEDYALSVTRAGEDYRKTMLDNDLDYALSVKRSKETFAIALADMAKDHDRQLKLMGQDYRKSVERAEEDFVKSITRMKIQTANAISDVGAQLAAQQQSAAENFWDMYTNAAQGKLGVARAFKKLVDESGIDITTMSQEMQDLYALADDIITKSKKAHEALRGGAVPQSVYDSQVPQAADTPAAPVLGGQSGNVTLPVMPQLNWSLLTTDVNDYDWSAIGTKVWGFLTRDFNTYDWGAIGKSIINGILAAPGNFGTMVEGWLGGLITSVKKFFKISSPSRVFMEIGGQLIAGLVQGITKTPGMVLDAFTGLFSGFGSFFSELGGNISKWATTAWKFITSTLPDVGSAVTGAFKTAGTYLSNLGGTVSGWVGTAWENVTKPIASLNIGEKVTGAFTTASSYLSSLGTKISSWITGAWDNITSPIVNLDIGSKVSGAFTEAGSYLRGLGTKISGWVTGAWDNMTSGLPSAKDIADDVSGAFTQAGTFLQGLGTKITGWMTTAWSSLTTGFPDIMKSVRSAFGVNESGKAVANPALWISNLAGHISSWLGGEGASAAFARVWEVVGSGFKTVMNSIIRAWNGLDFGIHIHIPAYGVGPLHTPKFDFDINDVFPDANYLASGGIVTSATNAVVGEAGPEAVIPLNERGIGILAKALEQFTGNAPTGMAPAGSVKTVAYDMQSTLRSIWDDLILQERYLEAQLKRFMAAFADISSTLPAQLMTVGLGAVTAMVDGMNLDSGKVAASNSAKNLVDLWVKAGVDEMVVKTPEMAMAIATMYDSVSMAEDTIAALKLSGASMADTVALGAEEAMTGPDGMAYTTVMAAAQALGDAAASAITAAITAAQSGGGGGGGGYSGSSGGDTSGYAALDEHSADLPIDYAKWKAEEAERKRQEDLARGAPKPTPKSGSKAYDPTQYSYRAGGGPTPIGEVFMAGEAGPELFISGQSGVVVPHGITNRLLGNAQARSAMVSQYATPTNVTYNHTQDYSTRITGPITVQSQNPDDMAAKLAARQRRQRLANPVGAR